MPPSNKNGLAEAERRIAEAKRTGATELDLSGLDLKGLTETVGELVQLQELFLNGNRLKQLPQSIGQHQNAKPVLIELTKTQPDEAEKAAKRLEQFVEAAKEKKPDKDFLQVTSKGLIHAAKT
jgi:Leucine-rich repeat (LRR) protein